MKKLLIAVCLLLIFKAQSQSLEKIRITEITRDIESTSPVTGTIDLTAEFFVPVTEAFDTLSGDTEGLALSYKNVYPINRVIRTNVDSVLTTIVVFKVTYSRVNIRKPNNSLKTASEIRTFLEGKYDYYKTLLDNFTPMPFDIILGTSLKGETWQPSN